MISPALMSSARTASGRDDWQTPPHVLDLVRQVAPIALDPCTDECNPTGAASFVYRPDGDGLAFSWIDSDLDPGLVYVNPPYSKIRTWLGKCAEEGRLGVEIIALVPARTDTRAWHDSASRADAICFWRGRLTFVGATAGAPFPSALLYWGERSKRFHDVFRAHGQILYTLKGTR